jgi:hypothetical protein
MEKSGQQINRYILEILLVASAVFFFSTKHLKEPYDKVIMAEGLGYYAYLPAVFIYHDLSFNFFNDIHSKYYATSYNPPTRNFILEFDGIRVNKYFPGVSFLWLPFFLVAHLLALLFHLTADGYSPIYQYAIGVAGLFYTYLGLVFTRKLLNYYRFTPAVQTIVLTGILFATNMLLTLRRGRRKRIVILFSLLPRFAGVSSGCLTIRRKGKGRGLHSPASCWPLSLRSGRKTAYPPAPAFLWIPMEELFILLRRHLFSPVGLAGILVSVLLLARVSYYWYLQTGKLFLQPYHGEAYYFNKPHVMDILFSFRKGWVLYSPFVAFGLAGIFFANSRKNRMNLFLFWCLQIYISSCWWCWTYSPSSFGQRPFVDFYSLIALQAAFFFRFLETNKKLWIAVPSLFFLVALNLLQTHQYRKGIIPGEFGFA